MPGLGGWSSFLGEFCSCFRGHHKGWIPITKLCLLVKDMKIKSLKEICLFSLPIKESEIIDVFLGASPKDELLKVMSVQKQAD